MNSKKFTYCKNQVMIKVGKKEKIFMFEYKVLTQKDKWFSGKFDPMVLEQAMNSYAKEGWRVKGVATASMGMNSTRDEIVVVLERQISQEQETPSIEDVVLPKL